MNVQGLQVAEYFLRARNFKGCRKYALEEQQRDPLNAAIAAQILAIADVMSASERRFGDERPDWYAILGVVRYSKNLQLIRKRFKDLISLINPNKNKFAFADCAFELVRDAWVVLSDPSRKAQLDNELRIFESRGKVGQCDDDRRGSGGETFWTACPYCYYVYEYYHVYKDCCLRCQNEKCGRGFQAVPIPSPPPAEIAKSGEYLCLGFSPIGFEGKSGKAFSLWMPFAPMFTAMSQVEVEMEEENACNAEDDGNSSPGELKNEMQASKVETEEGKMKCERKIDQMGVPNIGKPLMKRKKSVAIRTMKLMGRGTRIKRDNGVEHAVGLGSQAAESGDDKEFGSATVRKMETGIWGDIIGDGLEFYEGKDDILVGLQNGF